MPVHAGACRLTTWHACQDAAATALAGHQRADAAGESVADLRALMRRSIEVARAAAAQSRVIV